MIHWAWLILAYIFGFLLSAICCVAGNAEKK
jgi:hypothetical protein